MTRRLSISRTGLVVLAISAAGAIGACTTPAAATPSPTASPDAMMEHSPAPS